MFSRHSAKVEPLPLNEFPLGTFFKTEKGYFLVHSSTKRYRFTSLRVLASWAPQRVVKASEQDPAVQRLRIVAKMKFRNGSLIWSLSDGRLYLIDSGKRRHIRNPDVLTMLGATKDDATVVSQEEIELHEIGEDLA